MKKILLVTSAALIAATSFASVSEAGWRHRNHNGAYLAGGIALGLLIASQPRTRYVEADEDYGYERECTTRKTVRINSWGEKIVKIKKSCY